MRSTGAARSLAATVTVGAEVSAGLGFAGSRCGTSLEPHRECLADGSLRHRDQWSDHVFTDIDMLGSLEVEFLGNEL